MRDTKSASGRYSTEQIFAGLRILWPDHFGCEPTFDEDTEIVDVFGAKGVLADLDFADVIDVLGEFFGFDCSHEEWRRWLRPALKDKEKADNGQNDSLTFGSLAEFIADRTEAVFSSQVRM